MPAIETTVKERPLLMQQEMVRATLGLGPYDLKTETRRTAGLKKISDAPNSWIFHRIIVDKGVTYAKFTYKHGGYTNMVKCPYGVVEDRLWVRESTIIAPKRFATPDDTCIPDKEGDLRYIQYLATSPDREAAEDYGLKATPSIHMPRWASRILLEITDIRCERLQEIDEAGARREGVKDRAAFIELINRINGAECWASNPWCWVVCFKRLTP